MAAKISLASKSSGGLAQLAPLDSASLHQQAYAQLRQALMSGKFAPGEALTLRGVAAALGTSVMPARDAIMRLTVERALESDGRRVRVPVMTLARLQDVTRFRLALEGEAAMLAAERATASEVAAMRAANLAVAKAQKAGRVAKFLVANEDFHFAVYRAAHNDILQSLIETLWLQVGPYLGYLTSGSTNNDISRTDLTAHDRLIDAIESGDPEAARRALIADLSESTDVFGPFAADATASVT